MVIGLVSDLVDGLVNDFASSLVFGRSLEWSLD